MPANIPLMLVVSATLATVTLSPHTAFAQFPPPPPMAGPPPIAAGGPPPLATGGPPAFAARPPMGPGGVPRAGPAPRLGEASAPRGALAAAERAGAGGGHAGRAVASAARGTSVTYNRFEGYGRYGGSRQGYRAAVAAGAYAAGATAAYAYSGASYGYSSETGCYYVYGRYRRVLICD
ncbi:hypothetical protein BF49_0536 [Bradyrhizobium sp.]|nr:hypothetical protein BF49_0536 [Bradyrhizobium sp.]